MIKLFVTGDNHFGKKYDRYPEAKERLIASRFESFEGMIRRAEEENCSFFVVTGDLFDNNSTVRTQDVRKTAGILSSFSGTVLVLPGNHDYYTGEEKLWKDFSSAVASLGGNVVLLKDMKRYDFDCGDETLAVYPAPCASKHSKENNLGWIKTADITGTDYSIGIAHGSLAGLSPDMNNEYYLMTEQELNAIPVDAWLIGHTHIPYPRIEAEKEMRGYKIFNPGTHEQTDLSNNTEGYAYVVTVSKADGNADVAAKSVVSGRIRFYDIALTVRDGDVLSEKIRRSLSDCEDSSVVRLRVEGTLPAEEYVSRHQAYEAELSRFIAYETVDFDLCEAITQEKIRAEFAEIGFAAEFLGELLDDPVEAQMAYQLLNRCRE